MKKPYKMMIRGKVYRLTSDGWIQRLDIDGFEPSKNWRVYGVAKRWNSRPILWKHLKKRLDRGERIEGYLYDIDYGTVRLNAGMYMGKIPKVVIWKVM